MAPRSQSEKTAVITGASSGIITSKLDASAIAIPKDLTEADAAEHIESELARRAIAPDLLVNNAGFGLMGYASDLDLDKQLSMIDLNVRTLTELSLRLGAAMKRRGQGGIINISSVSGFLPGPRMAVYFATKAYIANFTQALHYEMRPFGVTVTCVCPGVTRTDFQRRAGMEDARIAHVSMSMSAEQVAKSGYAGFKKNKRMVFTGFQNRLSAYASHYLPNALLLPVMNRLNQ